MSTIPSRFYRVSIKALILNETRDKFFLCREHDGRWELPGGGLDWGESTETCLRRELQEEMGLNATSIAERPSYFFTGQSTNYPEVKIANVLYEVTLEHFNFTPSDECQEIRFVTPEEVVDMITFDGPKNLAKVFKPEHHRNK